jgi:1,4-dihydroxy-2-naphthoate octaprenyltransferase
MWATASLYLLPIVFFLLGIFPISTILIFASLPLGYQLVNHVRQYHNFCDRVSNCKFIAVNLHFVSGMLLALGFILPRLNLM